MQLKDVDEISTLIQEIQIGLSICRPIHRKVQKKGINEMLQKGLIIQVLIRTILQFNYKVNESLREVLKN